MQLTIARFRVLIFLGVFCLLMAGCASRNVASPERGYTGATMTLEQLVAAINANNARIPSLWARFTYEATIVDPETGKQTYLYEENSSTLQYRAPSEFRLRASKTGAGLVLDLGINRERFWMIAPEPGPDAMWWGYVKPDMQISSQIRMSPQGILEVLGISTLNTDLLAEPAPVLRFNDYYRVYMLVWVKRHNDRYIATREVWYDMQTLLPTRVVLFDTDGRPILGADLKDHKPISSEQDAPRMATVYNLLFPESGTKMRMQLTRTEFEHDGAPNDNSFRFVRTIPVKREIRVDE